MGYRKPSRAKRYVEDLYGFPGTSKEWPGLVQRVRHPFTSPVSDTPFGVGYTLRPHSGLVKMSVRTGSKSRKIVVGLGWRYTQPGRRMPSFGIAQSM